MLKNLRKRIRKTSGQTMTEYAMIFLAIAVLAFAAYKTLGNSISDYVGVVANFIEGA